MLGCLKCTPLTYHRRWIQTYCMQNIQGGREINAIIVTDDYLLYKEPESPYNFFFLFNI